MNKSRIPLPTLPLIGLALAIVCIFLAYAGKAGYLTKSMAYYLLLIIIPALLIIRIILFARDIKRDGKKDVRELFGLKKYDNEAELRKWQNEGDPFAHLDMGKRDKFRHLEDAYAIDPNPKTILAMAQICESFGWKEGAELYYNQLLTDFKESKEAREVQNASRNK